MEFDNTTFDKGPDGSEILDSLQRLDRLRPPVQYMDVRLVNFITANMEAILVEWEAFARSIWPGQESDSITLRDSAMAMLQAVVRDMENPQSDLEENAKSKGRGVGGIFSDGLDKTSHRHAMSRIDSGFQLVELVEEYRALRASVIRLWLKKGPNQEPGALDEIIRFGEAIDQLMIESVEQFAGRVELSREIFLGMLGHDLRTPLHVVTMCALMLAESEKLDERSRGIALQINESVGNMKSLVNDLLEFASTRLGGEIAVSPVDADLSPLCREVLDHAQTAHPEHRFKLKCEDNLRGMWDLARLRQLILNLLCNAVQHGSRTAPIVLSARGEDDEVFMTVSNQGAAIPPENVQSIFEPMIRLHEDELSPGSKGVGLGLYIVREIARAHGGTIEAQSSEEETVFTLRLPRTAPT